LTVSEPHAQSSATHIIRKTRGLTKTSYSELGTQTGPTNPEHTTSNAQEVAVTIFYQPIFRKDQHIDLARPAIDTATALDNITTLRESIKPHPSPRSRCNMSLKLSSFDEVIQTTLPKIPSRHIEP
jgi:hypothetical protein